MYPFHLLLVLFAILSGIALVYVLRWERGYFIKRGKVGAWLPVRLATVPIAVVTVMGVVVWASSTSGMEGLAIFYFLLFTIVPVFWFGTHWMVGKLVKPSLSLGESVLIAGSPIALGIALSGIAHTLQPIAWSLLRAIGKV